MPTQRKTPTRMKYLPISLVLKADENKVGLVSGVASTNDIDLVRDIVEVGAFKESIEKQMRSSKPFFPLKAEHRTVIGKIFELNQTSDGLAIKAQMEIADEGSSIRHATADETYLNVKSGTQDSFSVGFRIIDEKMEVKDGRAIYRITKADLKEVSVVANPANPEAVIESIKSLEDEYVKKHGPVEDDEKQKTWMDFYVEKQEAQKEKFWQTLANKMNQPQ